MKKWNWEDERSGDYIHGAVTHSLLECLGCETVFYETASWNSEDVDLWTDPHTGETKGRNAIEKATYPRPETHTKPEWFSKLEARDPQLSRILTQMYDAYDGDGFILTAIGLRTALDRSTELLGIDPAISFEEKLSALLDEGWVGESEQEVLKVVTHAGNAAAHRGWEPSKEEIGSLLRTLESFLHRAFIVGNDALDVRDSIPPKPRRRPSD